LQAASDWLQRLDEPELPEEDLQAWLKWHGESDQNRQAFEEMQLLYRRLRDLPAEYRRELRQRIPISPTRRSQGWQGLWALAAALVLVIGGAGGTWWWQQGATGALVVYAAPHDQHRAVKLADGSTLVLAQDAIASVQYTRARRSLNIERGQAYFEVTHNPSRPFVVQAGAVRVTAVGTSFNVARADDQIAVTVTDGVVDVVRLPVVDDKSPVQSSSPAAAIEHQRVAMGQRIVFGIASSDSQQWKEAAAAWRNGQIQFVNAPLREVVQAINRYALNPVVIDDPRVADLTFSGTVFRDHVDEWAAALSKIFPVRTVALNDGTLALVSSTDRVGMK